MVFITRQVVKEDLDLIYPTTEESQLENFTFPKKTFPIVEREGRIAIDSERRAFLLSLPARHREDGTSKYLFGWKNAVAILENAGYCRYSFIYISKSLLPELEVVQQLIREAFKKAGTLIDETSAKDEVFAVPKIEFIGIKDIGGKA